MKHRVLFLGLGAAALSVAASVAVSVAVSLWADWNRPDSVLRHDTLPFYASADLRPRWDRISALIPVRSLRMVGQHSNAVSERLFDNGPTVVNLFFAGCVSVCPVSMDLLRTLQASLGERAPQFVSLTVSPLTDDVPALAAYAAKFGLPREWVLLTGEPKRVEDWVRGNLYADITRLGADGLPPHTERAFLIDRRHRIRGLYDARQPHEMVRLRHDIASLRTEESAPPS